MWYTDVGIGTLFLALLGISRASDNKRFTKIEGGLEKGDEKFEKVMEVTGAIKVDVATLLERTKK